MKQKLMVGLVVLVALVSIGFIGCAKGSVVKGDKPIPPQDSSGIVKWDTPQIAESKIPPYCNPWTGVGLVPAGGSIISSWVAVSSQNSGLSTNTSTISNGKSFVLKNPYIVLISPLSAYHNAIRQGADPSWAVATYLGGGSVEVGRVYLQRWSPIQDNNFGGYER